MKSIGKNKRSDASIQFFSWLLWAIMLLSLVMFNDNDSNHGKNHSFLKCYFESNQDIICNKKLKSLVHSKDNSHNSYSNILNRIIPSVMGYSVRYNNYHFDTRQNQQQRSLFFPRERNILLPTQNPRKHLSTLYSSPSNNNKNNNANFHKFHQDKISQKTLKTLKSKLNILDIIESDYNLQKFTRTSATQGKACCPFHNEKTPSFFIDSKRKMFKCFGCGVGGDVFQFARLMNKEKEMGYYESVKHVAKKYLTMEECNNLALFKPSRPLTEEEKRKISGR